MKVNIGMRHGGGQLSFDTTMTAEQLAEALRSPEEVLDLEDTRGDRALIPVESISYVIIPSERETKVGFARL